MAQAPVSSSRRTVCKALLAALALPLACRKGGRDDPALIRRGPRLRFGAGELADTGYRALAARMLLASVPDRRLASLVSDVRDAGKRIAIQNVTGADEREEVIDAELASVRGEDLLPVQTAAAALASGIWTSPALGMWARAVPAREAKPGDMPAWAAAEPDDKKIAHMRFVAWALTRAAVIGVAPERSRPAHEELVARSVSRESTIALCAGGTRLKPRPADPMLARMCAEADVDAALQPLVCALAAGSDGRPALPVWLDLADGEWIVVPKLSTLAWPQRFAAEVSELAARIGARLLVHPAAR